MRKPSRASAARRNRQHNSARRLRVEQLEDRRLLAAGPWYDLAELTAGGDVVNNSTVAIDGDTIVIGSKTVDSVADQAGVAHIYQRDDAGTPLDPGDDGWSLQQELLPADLQAYDWFGTDVAISGDSLVVTARHPTAACCPTELPGDGLGVAYVYERDASDTWVFKQKLEPSVRVPNAGGFEDALFGWTVAMEGDLIAVTAPREDHLLENSTVLTDAGAAYLYRRDAGTGAWTEEARIVDPNAETAIGREGFSANIDINQGEIVITANRAEGSVVDSGTIQVFAETAPGEWKQTAEFWAIEGQSDSRFGSAVSKEGNTIVVGADQANFGAGDQSGAAYVFVRDTSGVWTEEARLLSNDLEEMDLFGRDVKMQDQTVAIGNWRGNGLVTDTGAIYIYERDAGVWVESDKIFESDRIADGTLGVFGDRFAWDGDQMVITSGKLNRVSVFVQDATRTRTPYFSADTPLQLKDAKGRKAGNTTSQLAVGDSGTVLDIDVRLDISHTRDSDLSAFLIAPDGTEVPLVANLGGNGDNYSDTLFSDEADSLIADGAAPFQGSFQPIGSLSDFDGLELNGTWQLRISDDTKGETGTLNNWSLIARYELPEPTLPTISIDDVQLAEGDLGTTAFSFTVTRDGDTTGTSSVDFATADGTASAASDYVATNGTVQFLAGETTNTITIQVNGDTSEESTESFFVNLSAASGAVIQDNQGVGTITDDDASGDPNALYVYDIRFDSKRGGKDWRAVVEIRSDSNADGQVGSNDEVRAGVSVTVSFGGNTYSGTTDSNGVMRTAWIRDIAAGNHYANVDSLFLTGYFWDPLDLDDEDDSDGDGKPDDLLVI